MNDINFVEKEVDDSVSRVKIVKHGAHVGTIEQTGTGWVFRSVGPEPFTPDEISDVADKIQELS